jgi:hypothetical protein
VCEKREKLHMQTCCLYAEIMHISSMKPLKAEHFWHAMMDSLLAQWVGGLWGCIGCTQVKPPTAV